MTVVKLTYDDGRDPEVVELAGDVRVEIGAEGGLRSQQLYVGHLSKLQMFHTAEEAEAADAKPKPAPKKKPAAKKPAAKAAASSTGKK